MLSEEGCLQFAQSAWFLAIRDAVSFVCSLAGVSPRRFIENRSKVRIAIVFLPRKGIGWLNFQIIQLCKNAKEESWYVACDRICVFLLRVFGGEWG